MATTHNTLHDFKDRYLTEADSAEITLEELWTEYNPRYPHGVDRVDFRWHLEQVLPESVSVEKPPHRDEITYVGVRCGTLTTGTEVTPDQ